MKTRQLQRRQQFQDENESAVHELQPPFKDFGIDYDCCCSKLNGSPLGYLLPPAACYCNAGSRTATPFPPIYQDKIANSQDIWNWKDLRKDDGAAAMVYGGTKKSLMLNQFFNMTSPPSPPSHQPLHTPLAPISDFCNVEKDQDKEQSLVQYHCSSIINAAHRRSHATSSLPLQSYRASCLLDKRLVSSLFRSVALYWFFCLNTVLAKGEVFRKKQSMAPLALGAPGDEFNIATVSRGLSNSQNLPIEIWINESGAVDELCLPPQDLLDFLETSIREQQYLCETLGKQESGASGVAADSENNMEEQGAGRAVGDMVVAKKLVFRLLKRLWSLSVKRYNEVLNHRPALEYSLQLKQDDRLDILSNECGNDVVSLIPGYVVSEEEGKEESISSETSGNESSSESSEIDNNSNSGDWTNDFEEDSNDEENDEDEEEDEGESYDNEEDCYDDRAGGKPLTENLTVITDDYHQFFLPEGMLNNDDFDYPQYNLWCSPLVCDELLSPKHTSLEDLHTKPHSCQERPEFIPYSLWNSSITVLGQEEKNYAGDCGLSIFTTPQHCPPPTNLLVQPSMYSLWGSPNIIEFLPSMGCVSMKEKICEASKGDGSYWPPTDETDSHQCCKHNHQAQVTNQIEFKPANSGNVMLTDRGAFKYYQKGGKLAVRWNPAPKIFSAIGERNMDDVAGEIGYINDAAQENYFTPIQPAFHVETDGPCAMKRSVSGNLYVQSKKYMTFSHELDNIADSSSEYDQKFRPKFQVNLNDKACQTDDLAAFVEWSRNQFYSELNSQRNTIPLHWFQSPISVGYTLEDMFNANVMNDSVVTHMDVTIPPSFHFGFVL